MRRRFPLICLGFTLLVARVVSAQVDASGWAQVPGILARIVPPTFPTNDFPITDYGAVGDGTTDCTEGIANAITACNGAGGGRVVVPAGTFFTGAIHLLSNVNLYVAKNATLKFSPDTNAYLPVVFTRWESTEVMNWSPFIYALDQENIAITGEGLLDGQQGASGTMATWKNLSTPDSDRLVAMGETNAPVSERIFGPGHFLRPYFVQPVRCRNVLIEGVSITNTPMWVLSPCYCTNVTVRNVTVNTAGANSDGCDPDSCTDVLIRNCSFSEGDDCIAIKAGRNGDGRRVNIPSRNIVIQNCKFQNGHGGVTMGSETSAGISNVFTENCAFNSSSLQMAMRFKTCPDRGGGIENVFIRNCVTKTAQYGIHMTMHYCESGTNYPVIRNIDIRDCMFKTLTSGAIFMQGWDTSNRISNVNISNCRFGGSTSTFSNTTNIIRFNNRGGGA